MNLSEIKNTSTEYHVKVTINSKSLEESCANELTKIAKTIKMDGFRVGKVPVSVVKKKYNDAVRFDVVKDQINDSINKIVQDKNLNVTGQPDISDLTNEPGKDLEYVVKFDLLPKIDLPDFKKISIDDPKLKVSDKEVDEQLKNLAKSFTAYEKETKAAAKNGDQVIIDSVGYADGEAFEGGKLEDTKLVLGSKRFIPGFEDQLVGSKAGQDIEVNVTFPENYHEKSLAGKPAQFKTTVKKVLKGVVPEINDELAKKLQCKDLEDLKAKVTENLQGMYQNPVRVIKKVKLFDQLEEMLDFAVPDGLLQKEIKLIEEQSSKLDEQEAEESGEKVKKKTKKEEKETQEEFENIASRRVRIGLMLAEYVKQKNIALSDDDIGKAVMAQARNFPGQEKAIIDFYQKQPQALESLKGAALEEKAVDYIFENEVKLKEKLLTKDKLDKLIEEENKD